MTRKSVSWLGAVLLLASSSAFGQAISCSLGSTTPTAHAEGLAELLGTLTFACSGGTAGSSANLSLYVALNTNITNPLDANGNPLNISITTAFGSAAPVTATLRVISATAVEINFSYTVPTPASLQVLATIQGIRGAVGAIANGTGNQLVSATLLGVGFTLNGGATQLFLATSAPSLLTSNIDNGVPCGGSPLPATLDFPTFSQTSASSTVRVTEASPAAFAKKDAFGGNTGTRILVKFSGYSAGARVFVPDAISGNDSTAPTSAGAYNSSITGGQYTPGTNQLLFLRVNGADNTGLGGAIASIAPGAVSLTTVTELSLTNGVGFVVYEVADSNPNIVESAQIPFFVVAPQTACTGSIPLQTYSLSLAPVSTVSIATATDPVPRFLAVTPGSDCQQNNDCSASYFPSLSVSQTPLALSGSSQGPAVNTTLFVGNSGGGVMGFSTSIAYQSGGSGWLSINPANGQNNTNLTIIANPALLQPGVYTATITINAGVYGTPTVPVTFTVGPVGIKITSVGNAASFQYSTVAPGSYAVVFGTNLAGTKVGVTFNGLPATIVYAGATQINLIVPTALGLQVAADVVATVDTNVSNSLKVNLLPNEPGIFNPGIVNFTTGAINTSSAPASRGDFVIVYLTGLALPVTGLTVNIGNLTNLIPSYAGAQGTFPALDQVNIAIPMSLAPGTGAVPFTVCVPGIDVAQVCSNQVNLYVQ